MCQTGGRQMALVTKCLSSYSQRKPSISGLHNSKLGHSNKNEVVRHFSHVNKCLFANISQVGLLEIYDVTYSC